MLHSVVDPQTLRFLTIHVNKYNGSINSQNTPETTSEPEQPPDGPHRGLPHPHQDPNKPPREPRKPHHAHQRPPPQPPAAASQPPEPPPAPPQHLVHRVD